MTPISDLRRRPAPDWRFRGGGHRRRHLPPLAHRLDGTPMPSFSDLIDQKWLTDEQLWRVAQYVRSLSPAAPPDVRDVIHAPQVSGGGLPLAPDDSAWNASARAWFPLVGQVIRKPRWFDPAVMGVWVQAVHDESTLALRISWDDRSQSPDSAWLRSCGACSARWERRLVKPTTAALADQLIVQFPVAIPRGWSDRIF